MQCPWILYDLAANADVSITIYNAQGQQIRTLSLGAQPAGAYQTKEKAAYWDRRSEKGEQVVSSIYFYHLQVNDASPDSEAQNYQATKKMIILK